MYLWYCLSDTPNIIDHAMVLTNNNDLDTRVEVFKLCIRAMRAHSIEILPAIELSAEAETTLRNEARLDLAFIG